jgi:hypothetical protein
MVNPTYCGRFGRKNILMVCLSGVSIYAFCAIAAAQLNSQTVSLILLYIGASTGMYHHISGDAQCITTLTLGSLAGCTSGERIIYNAILSDVCCNLDSTSNHRLYDCVVY